jgi:uncharacterized delta-60 repeat protein
MKGLMFGRIFRLALVAGGVASPFAARPFTFVDPTFTPSITLEPGQVRAWVQADQKILASADALRSVNGRLTPSFVRLNPDGSLDDNFRVPGDSWAPWTLGFVGEKIVYAAAWRIRRVHGNGATDDSFFAEAKAPLSGWQAVYHIFVQPDASVFVSAGMMNDERGGPVFKLTPSGAIDRTYHGADNPVFARQPDGKLIATASIRISDYIYHAKLVRMDADANLNPTFNSPPLTVDFRYAYLQQAELQADGKIVVVGTFDTVDGKPRPGFARFNSDGSLDETFITLTPSNSLRGPMFASIAIAADQKIYVTGRFESVGGVPRSNIARLLSDGSVDPTFVPERLENDPTIPLTVRLQADGKLIVSQDYPLSSGVEGLLARLNTDGSIDSTFKPLLGGAAPVFAMAAGTTRIYVGGNFRHANGVPKISLAAFTAEGKLDPTFKDPLLDRSPTALLETADGKLLVGGSFTNIDSVPRIGLARLHHGGSLDTGFESNLNPEAVAAIALEADGQILVSGKWNGVFTMARLQENGAVDRQFDVHATRTISAIVPLAGKKILVAGDTLTSAGQERKGVVRLNADGSVDPTFTSAIGLPHSVDAPRKVRSITVMADGKLLASGSMTNEAFPNKAIALVRLNENGSLDSSFAPVTFVAGTTYSDPAIDSVRLPDGRILISGNFTQINGKTRIGIARINPDGALDEDFDISVYGDLLYPTFLRVDATGNAMLGGYFSQADGMPRTSFMRVLTDAVPHPEGRALKLVAGRFDTLGFQMLLKGMSRRPARIETSTNMTNWFTAAQTWSQPKDEEFITVRDLKPTDPPRFFRAVEIP